MRVGGVGADAAVGAVVGEEALARDSGEQELDHAVLVDAATAADRFADALPTGSEHTVEAFLRSEVRGDLVFGENGFELADEVGGADDLLAERAQDFDRTRVDHGDVHDGVARRILHRDLCGAGEHGFQAALKLLPGGVLVLVARQRIQLSRLDAMNELLRLAVCRDKVVPAARDKTVREAKDAVRDWVAVVVVVEEPAFELGVADCGLECLEIHAEHDFTP